MKKAFSLTLIIFFFLTGFTPASAGERTALTIAAASDLSFALREITELFHKETGVKAAVSFGSTGMLAAQIRHGAPFDVFLSADFHHIEDLEKDGFIISGTAGSFAEGRLAIAINKSTGIIVSDMKGLLDKRIRRVSIANPDHAPYGRAAVEALKNSGVWEGVKGKLVYGENVRQAMQFIETGDAEAGIVALSIATAPGIRYVKAATQLHSPIRQAAGVVRGCKEEANARAFIAFLKGPKAKDVLRRYGFQVGSDKS